MPILDDAPAAFLDSRRIAYLATASAAGVPHVVPICFARIGDRLYVALDEKPKRRAPLRLRRVRNILENPRVAVVADDYDEDWSKLRFLLMSGSAHIVTAGEEHTAAVAALRARYPQYRHMALEERPLIAVEVERASAWGTSPAD